MDLLTIKENNVLDAIDLLTHEHPDLVRAEGGRAPAVGWRRAEEGGGEKKKKKKEGQSRRMGWDRMEWTRPDG